MIALTASASVSGMSWSSWNCRCCASRRSASGSMSACTRPGSRAFSFAVRNLVVGDEPEVVADEDARPKSRGARQAFVVAVLQAAHIGVFAIGALQRQGAEETRAVRRHAVLFVVHDVTIHSERALDEVNDAVMRNRYERGGCRRRLERAQAVVVHWVGPSVSQSVMEKILLA